MVVCVIYIHKSIKQFIKRGLRLFSKVKPTQVIVIGFALVILLGATLLNMPFSSKNGQCVGFVNALFTATSATCVTGLVVVDTYTHWTAFGKVVILSLIQIGGLGFMTLATMLSFFLRRTITMKERLLMAESINYEQMQGVVKLVQHILIGTFAIEGIGAVILAIRFIPEYGWQDGIIYGVFHSISSFCNAGFDLMGRERQFVSLTGYVGDWTVNLTVMSLIVLGGLGFIVWEDVVQNRRWSKFRLHTKVVLLMTALLIFGGALCIYIFEAGNPKTLVNATLSEKILAPLFQSVTSRTAGYNTLVLSDLTYASMFIMIILMFIGGSPGSTAGGVKTSTVGVILFTVWSVFRGSEDVNIYGRRIARLTVLKALVLIVLGFAILTVGSLLLLSLEEFTFMEVLYEVTSAFGTVGCTLGITPYLSSLSKIVLTLIMYTGRVGIMTIGLAITLPDHNGNNIKYPEGKILIG